jgi:hypothetical protein
MVNGTFVGIRLFNEHTGLPLNREQYYDLKSAYTKTRKKMLKEGSEHMRVVEFLASFKKDSKKIPQNTRICTQRI